MIRGKKRIIEEIKRVYKRARLRGEEIDYCKYAYKGKIYSLRELIEKEIELSEKVIKSGEGLRESLIIEEILDIMKITYWDVEEGDK